MTTSFINKLTGLGLESEIAKEIEDRFINNTELISGLATLSSGAVTVATTAASTSRQVVLARKDVSGVPGELRWGNVVAGTSFDIVSDDPSDNSTVSWVMF